MKILQRFEYRLCGVLYSMDERAMSFLHLKKGLLLDYDYRNIIKEVFPVVFDSKEIQKIMTDFKRN